jgi:hypothetical protein
VVAVNFPGEAADLFPSDRIPLENENLTGQVATATTLRSVGRNEPRRMAPGNVTDDIRQADLDGCPMHSGWRRSGCSGDGDAASSRSQSA